MSITVCVAQNLSSSDAKRWPQSWGTVCWQTVSDDSLV